ncbi:MAG TPA: ISAs1 family transposase [Anaerolineales bacterium]|jgi:predicted transposase YbfD/YdcC|nr:ISAs1 family transposase [Anaerolineales bacterium]
MPKKPLEAIEQHFSKVTDPRVDRTKEHKLMDMIVIAICAVICGAEGWTDIENFGNSKLPWLKSFLELPNGIPSHDTFGRVFSMLDAEQFQLAFYEWVLAVNEIVQGQIINIDGKRLAGSEDKYLGKRAIYMVSAWAEENEIVLGQRKVDEKSNEITAIPELLKILAISGCIVTIDAIGTQTNIAKTIIAAEADYVLSVKENQGHLFEDISVLFAVDQAHDFKYATLEHHQEVNKGHGRIETRECWCTSEPAYLNLIRDQENWVGLCSIAMVISTRMVGDKQTKKTRYYISSLPSDPEKLMHVVRRHWAIENELHWVLDVAMNEDHSRVRKDQAPENLAVLRHIALNLLKQEKTAKGGIHAKQLQAAWKEDYLLKVLSTGI